MPIDCTATYLTNAKSVACASCESGGWGLVTAVVTGWRVASRLPGHQVRSLLAGSSGSAACQRLVDLTPSDSIWYAEASGAYGTRASIAAMGYLDGRVADQRQGLESLWDMAFGLAAGSRAWAE